MVMRLLPAALAASILTTAAFAQEDGPYAPLKRNVEAFSGILADALELDDGAGPFRRAGDPIDSTYLAGHGIVLEVRSSLAGDRGRLNLAILNSSMIALRESDSPFAMLARQRAFGEADQAATAAADADSDARRPGTELLQRAAEIDTSALVDSAIVQAGEYARMLRDADGVDSETFEALRADIEALRRENLAGADRLRELTEELRANALAQGERFEEAVDELSLEMAQLRARAESFAAELRQRSESAQADRAERWQDDVAGLEQRLTLAMCDYGASLRELPATESVTVVLAGLGDESASGGRSDLVHSYRKADLLRCAGGDINPATLGELSARYSY